MSDQTIELAAFSPRVTIIHTYDCGCGFRTSSLEEATRHVGETRHTVTVHGRIINLDALET